MTRNHLNCQSAPYVAGVPHRIMAPEANGQAGKTTVVQPPKTVSFHLRVSQGTATFTKMPQKR